MRGARSGALVALLLLGAGAGCGLFKPRSPEKPIAPAGPCLDITSTSNIIINIVTLYAKPGGGSCYATGLDPAFIFHADPTDSAEAYPALPWVNWTRDKETADETNMAAAAESVRVSFDGEYTPPIISQDSETHYFNYHVLFRATGSDTTLRYQGQADITFKRNTGDNKWRILDWADKRDGSGYPTWGTLRRPYSS